MLKSLKRIASGLLVAAMLAGVLLAARPAATQAAIYYGPKPGNCRFDRWNSSNFKSCRVRWNRLSDADGYEVLVTWTDGSSDRRYYTVTSGSKTYLDISGLNNAHVYQAKVRGLWQVGSEWYYYTPWSNLTYITPSPSSSSGSLVSSSSMNVKLKWNTIYGCNGYNLFLTTNPSGKWYWNQSTAVKASATSATIKKFRGSKLKYYTNYYYRIVTRRKRNGVFCTVPMPSSSYYTNGFYLYKRYY